MDPKSIVEVIADFVPALTNFLAQHSNEEIFHFLVRCISIDRPGGERQVLSGDFWGQNYLATTVVLGMLACATLLSYDGDHDSITRATEATGHMTASAISRCR